jgi:hypothetical protein
VGHLMTQAVDDVRAHVVNFVEQAF